MFFIPKIAFVRNVQNICAIVERMKEPFFRIYPFLYENKKELCKFKETSFIIRLELQLNIDQ